MRLVALFILLTGTALAQLDTYGGRNDISCTNTNNVGAASHAGVFTIAKVNNRWWYCTPAGHVFVSMNFNLQYVNSPTPTNNTAYIGPSVRVTAASFSGGNTTYTYSVSTSCVTLGTGGTTLTGNVPAAIGNTVTINGMADAGNNVTAITISSTGSGTFTIPNASGVTHAGQTGCANYFQNGYLSYAAKYAYGTDTLGIGSNREWQALKRATGWGFNSVGIDTTQGFAWETCSGGSCIWPGGVQPIPVPSIVTWKPTLYASANNAGYLTSPIKDGAYAITSNWAPSIGGEFYDIFDPQQSVEASAELAGALSTSSLYRAVTNSPWVFGVSTDDSDWFEGTGSAGDFQNVGIQPNYGFITMVTSPMQTMNPSSKFVSVPEIFQDTLNYTKAQATNPGGSCNITTPCSLRDYLWKKYTGTIATLNTAWGSSYTTFDSSGTQVASESVGTGDGTTVTFTHTLAHTPVSPFSVAVSVAGTVMSGDQPWFKYAGTTNTGKILGVAVTTKISAASQSGSNTTYTYTTPASGNAVYPSQPVTITAMADAVNNGSFIVSSVSTGNGIGTFTVVNASGVTHSSQNGKGVIVQSLTASTINYSTGAVSLTFTTAPANGAAITVAYIYGGWQAGGTGLMDEDGSNSWVGTNAYCLEGANPSYPTYFACTGGGGSQYRPVVNALAAFGADIDGWLSQYIAEYHKTILTDLRASGSLVPFLGLDNFGTGGPPFGVVIAGAAPYVDVIQAQMNFWEPTAIFNPPSTPSMSVQFPSMYQYITQYAGDKPLADHYISVAATADSDEAFNIGNALQGSINEMPTQGARGQMYYHTVSYLLSTPSYNGDYQYMSFAEWAWQDFQFENWGLVSLLDNAYDGVEAVSATVSCDSNYTVAGGATCGGEPSNYGNSITPISAANTLWLSAPRASFGTNVGLGKGVAF